MALSMVATIRQIRVLIAQITSLSAVYAASESDGNALPAALQTFPCVVIVPGGTTAYLLSSGGQRHSYEVQVFVFQSGADIGQRAQTALPLVDLIIAKFVANVGMGTLANPVLFRSQGGQQVLEYAGMSYTGYEIILEVSEQATAAPAIGA